MRRPTAKLRNVLAALAGRRSASQVCRRCGKPIIREKPVWVGAGRFSGTFHPRCAPRSIRHKMEDK